MKPIYHESKPNGNDQTAPAGSRAAEPQPTKRTGRRLSPTQVRAVLDGSEASADRIERLLSRAQVAHRLGTCTHTVQRLTRRGVLPALIFNSRLIRYTPAAVEAFIQSAVTGKGGVQ